MRISVWFCRKINLNKEATYRSKREREGEGGRERERGREGEGERRISCKKLFALMFD